MHFQHITAFVLLLTAGCIVFMTNAAAQVQQLPVSASETLGIAPVAVVPDVVETITTEATKPKTTKSTTTTTTSTTSSTTTTTPAPEPEPTTSSTTTTTTTTTPAPTTTTPAPVPTTTPAPAPYPQPQIGKWNSSCVMVHMAVQLNFTYETKDNKSAYGLYNIPPTATVGDNTCDSNTTQTLQVNWGPSTGIHSMYLLFTLKDKNVKMSQMQFNLPLTAADFPDAKENQYIQLIHLGEEFDAPVKMSYHCTRAQKFNLTEIVPDKTVIGIATVHDVHIQAFLADKATDFSTARDCDSSETPDIVPIAVGIALAALISIVLISYLCARRRSTSRGYMSF